ncbi:hypothetical protein GCM10018980_74550 [Streptomyces capoamus]|uniref:Uncharacterized protein n=1 Tax=Streptomyces capoamus TaxID=68183 RepID=A0A919KGB2_9ACTN|nr:hypothetical protein GCM10010501_58010 [Streptomyces libani subsp. rufus]GHG76584.1 hypothetical protein GCM10018980_74550 [Streptomyces capoamus]
MRAAWEDATDACLSRCRFHKNGVRLIFSGRLTTADGGPAPFGPTWDPLAADRPKAVVY